MAGCSIQHAKNNILSGAKPTGRFLWPSATVHRRSTSQSTYLTLISILY